MRRKLLVLCGVALWCLSLPLPAAAEDFPSRPIRLVVPVPPGGGLDLVGRLIAQPVSERSGQAVVVDNRSGAATNVGSDAVAKARGDGYTILINTLPLVVNPSLFAKMSYNFQTDLTPVTLVCSTPLVLVVASKMPVSNVDELIQLAKKHPGKLTYASTGYGTNLHIAAELFKQLAAIDILHVPYQGVGQALTATLTGEVDISFVTPISVSSYTSSGKLKALAVTSAKRSTALPQLPTMAEAGVTGYDFTSWYGVLAPGTTPPTIIAALNKYFVEAARSPAVVERLGAEGADIVASSPEDFRRYLNAEYERWTKLLKQAGITPQ